ncbi:hypothetical protein QE152_g26639 [Popillia japonica]|uniref:Uncharacterized protein n=1 Tax=Popillia japonica TaxID=7064 RepID=A0AAW1JXL6_POPJA
MDLPLTELEFNGIIGKIKTKSTMDHYGISTKLLKDIAPHIADPIISIINRCLDEGIFPDEFKISKISQHGFRKNKSTETGLSESLGAIIEALDSQEHVRPAAFDMVDHQLVLDKQCYYGIRGTAHDLLSSYLSNRQQYVETNLGKSTIEIVQRGVSTTCSPHIYQIDNNTLRLTWANPL